MTPLRVPAAAGVSLLAALALASPSPSLAAEGQDKPSATTFAVIGDVPYGDAQIAAFPGWIDRINDQAGLDLAFHVGDIKTGSSPCTDDYNGWIREQFDRFEMPLLYTPGDNEWTDCHRTAAGSYNPLERLDALRAAFYETPGLTLGSPMEATRMAVAIDLVEDAFTRARQTRARAVAIFQQADMFDPSYQPTWDVSAFQPLVQALVDEASTFDGEVYLFDGDSHVYNVDRPLAAGSRWLEIHGVQGSADNLTRVTVDGEANNTNFLQVTLNRPGADHVLSWVRVPYDSQP
jgi:hypothetical protein